MHISRTRHRSSLWWLWFWLIYTCLIQKLIIKCKLKSICFFWQLKLIFMFDVYCCNIPVTRILFPYQGTRHNQCNYTNQLKANVTFAFQKYIVNSERSEKNSKRPNQPITHRFGSHIDWQPPRFRLVWNETTKKKNLSKILPTLHELPFIAILCRFEFYARNFSIYVRHRKPFTNSLAVFITWAFFHASMIIMFFFTIFSLFLQWFCVHGTLHLSELWSGNFTIMKLCKILMTKTTETFFAIKR